MLTFEINFDGIIGPTHNYAGLAYGNVASQAHEGLVSHPKQAALQGVQKMKRLFDLGLPQAVLPPQERPHLPTLRRLGFSGKDFEVITKAYKKNPKEFLSVCSAASMWTANAATVSPSADTQDHQVHITPANLFSKRHRSIEAPTTARVLKTIFPEDTAFVHHDPLPQEEKFGDEGAANHTRLCESHEKPGVELFVFGKKISDAKKDLPKRFPARQTLEASEKITKLHQLNPNSVVFAKQNPEAIDAGVFHNDVISVGNENVFFYHEKAFHLGEKIISELKEKFSRASQKELVMIAVSEKEIPLEEVVKTYLFNTQLFTLPNGSMMLLAPKECEESKVVNDYLKNLLTQKNHPVQKIEFVDVRQSMQNGGGPACLRLRVVLTEKEKKTINQNVLFSNALYERLTNWVTKHYREKLSVNDLADPQLYEEGKRALDELTQILNLGSVYEFQK